MLDALREFVLSFGNRPTDAPLNSDAEAAALVIGAERFDAWTDEVEDLKDRLAVYERDHATSLDKLAAELGENSTSSPTPARC